MRWQIVTLAPAAVPVGSAVGTEVAVASTVPVASGVAVSVLPVVAVAGRAVLVASTVDVAGTWVPVGAGVLAPRQPPAGAGMMSPCLWCAGIACSFTVICT